MESGRDTLGEFLRLQRGIAHLSLRQLSEMADVSSAYLSQVERGLYQPSAQVLKNIADALQLSVEALYARAGLLDEDERAPAVEEAIRLDDRLTTDQKETLIRVYRGFVGSA
jgi:transcriptional regulator with XRE-family HTH domain